MSAQNRDSLFWWPRRIRCSGFFQEIPQPVEVPPNIEVCSISSRYSAQLLFSSNPPLLLSYLRLCFFAIVGKPCACAIYVILVIIRMKVLAKKRKELSQTIVSLIGYLRTEMGCRRCDFYGSVEDENKFCILEEWDSLEDFDGHLKSERYSVLRGAMNLLQEPHEMRVHTVPAGT